MNYAKIFMLILIAAVVIWSRINCFNKLIWWMEAFPVFVVLPILLATAGRFPLTMLVYWLGTLHAIILLVGAKYSYARVPIGFSMQRLLHLDRNCYDRVGHWFQGFVPALLTRELLLRRTLLQPGKRLFFLVTCVCLAFSAFYELVEWWSAVILGQKADEFLGSQGDIWDSQWDMLFALVGSIVAQLTLANLHDKQLKPFYPLRKKLI